MNLISFTFYYVTAISNQYKTCPFFSLFLVNKNDIQPSKDVQSTECFTSFSPNIYASPDN